MGYWLSEFDRIERYAKAWGISVEHARIYFQQPELRRYFEESVKFLTVQGYHEI
jgi:Asp-tRNA(Asn)/Glu-tRNA(Gln) amidotransferase B subunit